jgi:hypothetical protein
MQSSYSFKGGVISLREPGMMFDSKTGKKTEWKKGIKIMQGKGSVVVGGDFVETFLTILKNPDYQEFAQDLMD